MKKAIISSILILISSSSVAQCNKFLEKTAPDSRYIINNDGTAYDKETNLTWMRCSMTHDWEPYDNVCKRKISFVDEELKLAPYMTHKEAKLAVVKANEDKLLGKNDWYLPDIKELSSIIELACSFPSINNTVFPSTDNMLYWSSSVPDQNKGTGAFFWAVNFSYGYDASTFLKEKTNVRLVRRGK